MKMRVINGDCTIGMAQYPDKYFDLAVVDPPYGMPKDSTHGRGKLKNRILNNGGVEKWDIKPNSSYFSELFRVSKNQIIWGGNYFGLPPTRGFLVWDKEQPFENFSAAEYAWISFQAVSKIFKLAATRTGDIDRIHPTQKPIKLYEWIYKNYLPEGGRVIDTHGGSMSNLIAAINTGNIDMDIYELDPDYYNSAKKRVENHVAQLDMFRQPPTIEWVHGNS